MRDRELNDIAKSISDLAELFKDLSSLVIDQGTLLDSVEYNIEQTVVEVQQAVKELDIATQYVHSRNCDTKNPYRRFYYRYQKNTGRRSCIFLLLLIIFGLVIVLVFKPRRDSDPSTSPPFPSGSPETESPAVSLERWTFRRRPPYAT